MTDQIKLVHRHYEGLMRGDLEGGLSGFAEDVETATPNGVLKGLPEFRALVEVFHAAMSDRRHEISGSWEIGDTVVVEGVFSGRNTGPMVTPAGTIPASGNAVSFPYADFFRFEDGVCVSHRIYWDNAGLLTQLGALP